MSDAAEIPSPCTNVCTMNERTGLCEGCMRTIDEIGAWSSMDRRQKVAVWDSLARRRELAEDSPPVSQAPSLPPR
jgi:predicted Fe-S protein YdhL (DUF1289 family)